MKFYSIKSIILVSALTLFGGCIGDLDVMPLDPNVMTAEDAYSTPERSIRYGPSPDKKTQVLRI